MKKIFCLLFILLPLFILSQKKNTETSRDLNRLDSLKLVVNEGGITVDDLANIIKIQRKYQSINEDSCLFYLDKEILLTEKIGNQGLIAQARLEKAVMLYKLRKLDLAEELLLMNIERKTALPDTILSRSFLALARIKVQKNMPSEAFEHTVTASEFYANVNDSTHMVTCFDYIAGIYLFMLNEPEKSIPYFEKALAYDNGKKKSAPIRLLINYSSALVSVSKFDQAIEKLKKAETLVKKANIVELRASVFVQYSAVYFAHKDYKKALEYGLLAKSIIEGVPTRSIGTKSKINMLLAQNYKALKSHKKALYYFKLIENTPSLDPWVIKSEIIEIYEEMEEYQKAFLLQQKVIAAKDSINELDRIANLKEITEKYENDKKQQEISTLNIEKKLQNNQIKQQEFVLYSIIAFFLLLVGISFYWFKTRIKLRETTQNLEKMQLQQRFLRTQLNPHFFFHALTSIESYIYSNDKIKAAGFLQSFSKLMRNILESSDIEFVSLQNDIDFIEKYIELQQLSNNFQFKYQINISPSLNPQDILVPPMLTQPFVENAILHGALSTNDGFVEIDYVKNGNQIEITISDNGKGEKQFSKSSNKLHRSMSSNITEERIKILKETHGMEISYKSIYSTENNKKKSVVFIIPLGFKEFEPA